MLGSMKVKTKLSAESARDRIVNVAMDLFYQQGFRATGINEVIEKSGVAKATFYHHFPTKEALCQVYLEQLRHKEISHLDKHIYAAKDALTRFLAPIRSVEPWLKETNFRGCPFVNIASEVPDFKHPLRKEGLKVYDDAQNKMQQVSQELVDSNPKRYGHLDVEQLTNDYLLIFAGAISLAEIYHDVWPVRHAEQTLLRLIGEA